MQELVRQGMDLMQLFNSKGRSCEENCTKNVMMHRACFPAADVCFLTACFVLPLLDLCQEFILTHFMVCRRNRASPTGRGKSAAVCQMMSVFGEDECDGGVDESERGRVCTVEVTGDPQQRS